MRLSTEPPLRKVKEGKMLTRTHYNKIADVLYDAINACREVGDNETVLFIRTRIVEELGDVFELDNPNFDYQRFIRACGVAKEEL